MVVWLILLSCSFPLPDCAEGYERNSSDDCVMQPDTGGSDDDRVAVTGEYVGSINLAVFAEAGPLEIEDNCVGSISFDRRDSELDGTVECAFEGTVDGLVNSQQFTGTIDGTIDSADAVGGQIVLDLDIFGVLDEPWTGQAGLEQITGTVRGEMEFEVASLVVPVAFDGQFEANR